MAVSLYYNWYRIQIFTFVITDFFFFWFQEQVVDSLKEIVAEASKQKWYLDRLISLVIEESPWLLDEVDSEFDSLTLTDQSEEFC